MENEVLEYIKKLTNKSFGIDDVIQLRSAQRARLYDWLITKDYKFTEEELLKSSFIIKKLLTKEEDTSKDHHQSKQILDHSNNNIKVIPRPQIEDFRVGVDIQLVSEIFPEKSIIQLDNDGLLRSIFTQKEIEYAKLQENPLRTLTGIFCVKESIIKAGSSVKELNCIEIDYDSNGVPLHNTYAISISYSGNTVIAIAVSKNFNTLKVKNKSLFKIDDLIKYGVVVIIFQIIMIVFQKI